MSAAFRPFLTVLARPNGSGKTTLFDRLNPPGEQINADKIARLINPLDPESASAAASRATLLRLGELLSARQNFSYETTLSGHQPPALMAKAELAGYRIELAYITLKSVELNVLRVRQRVLEGGHSIPANDIIRRYDRSLANLSKAIAMANEAAIFDNSESVTRLLFQMRDRTVVGSTLDPADHYHQRLAHAIMSGTALGPDAVYRPR